MFIRKNTPGYIGLLLQNSGCDCEAVSLSTAALQPTQNPLSWIFCVKQIVTLNLFQGLTSVK